MAISDQMSEVINLNTDIVPVASGQEALAPLADHLKHNIQAKLKRLEDEGHQIQILEPIWCRENPELAGQLHADIIIKTYGDTYALPNKDPEANTQAINEGNLDVYLLEIDGEVAGTTCLVNVGDGRAELGRSASLGRVGNTIIQDLRILDWLVNEEAAKKYHTLFATLRSAPDRIINDSEDGSFIMRGGQGVSAHWQKFPDLIVNGFAPLYLKHGQLEQFSCATITRNKLLDNAFIFVADDEDISFVEAWHDNYAIPKPVVRQDGDGAASKVLFEAHYPPKESGLTDLVHADIIATTSDKAIPLQNSLEEVEDAASPFTQVVLPIDIDTRELQTELKNHGYRVFGYQPAYENQAPALLFGKVLEGVGVVPTFWDHDDTPNPLWHNQELRQLAGRIAQWVPQAR